MLLVHYRNDWADYFTGTPTLIQKTEYGERQTPSNTDVYVLSCLFKSITSTSSGGALYCNSVTYFLVESSSFFSCKTSSSTGGAIYFTNGGGQSVLIKVCGYDCYITCSGSSYGQFIYTYVSNSASNMNYLNYSSITRCVNENTNSQYTIHLFCGKIICPSVNSSMNKCYTRSGIYIESNVYTCSSSYSSFADNIATGHTCVRFYYGGEIKSCNILRNSQVSLDTEGTIYTNGNLKIENSCILDNKATYIFRVQSSSYTITISNCTVDSTLNNGCLTIQNTVTKSFILALNHMSTQNCHSEYDSFGTLTPNIQFSCPSNKPMHYYTYVNRFNQSNLRIFFSLLSVFLFIFIHSDPWH
jgi:hypothetical protein